MPLTWINVVDTAVKIGLGAMISAASGYVIFVKTQANEVKKEEKTRFYKLQDEKKSKYVEFLSQSQDLIQSHLYIDLARNSEHYKKYLRVYNEVQIISDDAIRIAANKLVSCVSDYIFVNKNDHDLDSVLIKAANYQISLFQKIAQVEVTNIYKKNN